MGRKQEKGKKGEAVQYYSRKQALRYLQISLPNFIRLSSWKGIYPTQPNNIKAAGKGDTRPKIYYKRKDIKLLLHEPVVEKLRVLRAYNLKLRKAKERKDKDKIYRLLKCKPRYTLHHIVKELYPRIEDALYNLNDCLNSIFIFATLPKMTQFNHAYTVRSKRLKLEFMNYCISKQALRKCFISVKGFYFEVEIEGIKINWVMPHQNVAMNLPQSCDYRLMANQTEFDCVLLSCALAHLYYEAGLFYPPKFAVDVANELNENDIMAAMTFPVVNSNNEPMSEAERGQLTQLMEMDEELAGIIEKEDRTKAIKSLFKGKKIFLNREVPREIFCFVLRCCGAAKVSWDSCTASGATFGVDDIDIDYHVIDRPINADVTKVNRSYVQPQFVFDCINAARLLPVKDYLPGMKLIPHLSPFVDYEKGYVPPEYRYLQGEIDADELYGVEEESEDDDMEVIEEIEGDEDNDDYNEEEEEDDIDDEDKELKVESTPKVAKKTKVKQTRISRDELNRKIEANKEIKLKEISLPRKRLNLYRKMKHAEKKEKAKVENLKQKRHIINKKKLSLKK